MNENQDSRARYFDLDAAPDLSRDGWPEKFAKATVRRVWPPQTSEARGSGSGDTKLRRPRLLPPARSERR